LATASVPFYVLARGGRDFQLFNVSMVDLSNYTLTGPEGDATPVAPRMCIINQPTFDVSNVTQTLYGERVLSIRPVCKRFTVALESHVGGSATANVVYVIQTVINAFNPQGVGSNTGTFCFSTPCTWFGAGYLAMRGSVRYKVDGPYSMGPDAETRTAGEINRWLPISRQVYRTLEAGQTPGSLASVLGDISSFGTYRMGNGGAIGQPSSMTQGLLEFEIPDYSNNAFRSSYNGPQPTPAGTYEGAGQKVCVETLLYTPVASNTGVIQDRYFFAGGEDYQLLWYQGGPMLTN